MPWYALIQDSDGALLSLSTLLVSPSPSGTTLIELAIDPTDPAWMYDQATRGFVARPAKVLIDRLDDLVTNANYADFLTVWNNLSAQRKTLLRNMLIRLLGSQRFRPTSEPVEL